MSLRRIGALVSAAGLAGIMLVVNAPSAGATVSATYRCTASVLGSSKTFTFSFLFSGTAPAKVAPGATVKLTGWQAKITIPESLVSAMEADGVTTLGETIKSFDINATHAVVATVNAVGAGVTMAQSKLPKPAAAITIRVPSVPKTVGAWTAAAKAGTMTFTDGTVKMTFNDNLDLSVPTTCTPLPVETLGHTTVS